MIHIASYRLSVCGADGKPAELDIGLLEKRIADAYRKLGFTDVWMAEDVALTVEEKIRMSDGRFVTREEVDSIVLSVLNASGFRDVAQEYALGCGRDELGDARKEMKAWKGRLAEVLRHRLPLTEKQVDDVSLMVEKFLDAAGIAVVTDKFLVELAVHLLANNSADHAHFVDLAPSANVESGKICKPCVRWQDMNLGEGVREMMGQGILRAMPFSEIFPRARVAVMIGAVASVYSEGWLTPLGICVAFGRIAPCLLEMLRAMRLEISARHPLQADSPSHVVLPGFMEFLEQNPSLWKRRDRIEIREAVENVLDEKLVSAAEFPVAVSLR
ncbi:MAG: hypothetical protein IJS15_03940 [Victivallales bacterium]|nr:hypothetical protein [Victivallales bacterium]